ncbi:DUF1579 domain-containing protein [Xaviernesmea oryzae]|uniref:DUF1579 domain-containing protein n=1 Tax=Xaviernesmea oryzae TaxID=464029 RepID=A0A1Q9AVQ6_9HYPH|nr:DUF1579 family protein [Xaviernesmea oryzae]OLP59541.1 DUF1579 domain-containing protein [Xaviernesmea oryzae]SEM13989.1 Protein of unknown function [Xaviernesmea oryzae]
MANASSQLSQHHLRLGALVGAWVGDEQVAASAWTAAGAAESDVAAEPLFGGVFVEQRYRQVRDQSVAFESRNVFGFDATDQRYKLYQFDTFGFAPPTPASGVWEGDDLVFERSSPRGTQRTVFHFENEDSYRMSVSFLPAGGSDWQEVVSGSYRRSTSVSKSNS